MSRRTEKRKYGKYNKFDVVYADFGKNPHGIQSGIRPGIIISCYKVNQLVLVNLDIIDEYLETFHIVDDEFYK